MSAKVKRLQNVHVAGRNIAALSMFYEQVLGLPLKFRDGDRWVQYDAGGVGFSLAGPGEAAPSQQGAVAVFEVEDFEGLVARAEASGGQVEGIRDMGSHGSVMSMRDCEGNLIQLFRRALRPT